jgi:hypothetical protein
MAKPSTDLELKPECRMGSVPHGDIEFISIIENRTVELSRHSMARDLLFRKWRDLRYGRLQRIVLHLFLLFRIEIGGMLFSANVIF